MPSCVSKLEKEQIRKHTRARSPLPSPSASSKKQWPIALCVATQSQSLMGRFLSSCKATILPTSCSQLFCCLLCLPLECVSRPAVHQSKVTLAEDTEESLSESEHFLLLCLYPVPRKGLLASEKLFMQEDFDSIIMGCSRVWLGCFNAAPSLKYTQSCAEGWALGKEPSV